MKLYYKYFLTSIAFITIILPHVSAQKTDKVKREDIEWLEVWLPDSNNEGLPRVLFIGNSITRAYYPEVAKQLEGIAYTARLSTSKSIGDPALIQEINLVMNYLKFDVVHFNNGLHGWDYTEEEYKAAFPDFFDAIKTNAPDATLIWATITPVRTGSPDMKEFDSNLYRIQERNQIAADYLNDKNVLTNDLFSFVEHHPEYYAGGDGTHHVPVGVTAIANKVTEVVKSVLNNK